LREAVNKAAWAKNSLIHSQTGFSPFQLVFGRSPTLQMTSESTTGGLENLSGNEIARGMLYRQEQERMAMQMAENDMRYKTAMKDRLPKTIDIINELGDQVVFREGREGKLHDAKIVGFDGPIALLKWGNTSRRVPERELLPSYGKRIIIEDEEEGQEIPEEESDMEIIKEIIPRKRGPKRKKKTEIIPEISEKKVVKDSKRWEVEEEEDQQPTLEIWSEDEDLSREMNKCLCLTMPILGEHIVMWNLWGEKFSGRVMKIRKKKTQFKIEEHGTDATTWVELDKLNFWEYTRPPDPNEEMDASRPPSPQAEKAMPDDQDIE